MVSSAQHSPVFVDVLAAQYPFVLLKNTESPFGKILLHMCGLGAPVSQGVLPAVAQGQVCGPNLAQPTLAGTPIWRGITHGQTTEVEHIYSMDGA